MDIHLSALPENASVQDTDIPVTIISASDSRYLPGLLVTWGSILRSNHEFTFDFYLLHDGISLSKLNAFERDLCSVADRFHFHPVEVDTHLFRDFPDFFFDSKMAYARLLIPRLMPDVEQAVYIDSDFLVFRDIAELIQNLGPDDEIGVVEEWGYSGESDLPSFHESHPATRNHTYFNSGLLVLNLAKIRAQSDFDECLKLLAEHREDCKWHDQTALNVIFAGRCSYLDPNANYQLALGRQFSLEQLSLIENCEVNLHYMMGTKPWIKPGHNIPHRMFRYFEAQLKGEKSGAASALGRWPVLRASLRNRLSTLRLHILALLFRSRASEFNKLASAHGKAASSLWREFRANALIVRAFQKAWDRTAK